MCAYHKLDDFINKFFSQQDFLPVAQCTAGFLQLLGDPLPEWSQTKWDPCLIHSLTSNSCSSMFPGVIKPLVSGLVLHELVLAASCPWLRPIAVPPLLPLYLPLPLLSPVPRQPPFHVDTMFP